MEVTVPKAKSSVFVLNFRIVILQFIIRGEMETEREIMLRKRGETGGRGGETIGTEAKEDHRKRDRRERRRDNGSRPRA